MKKAKKAVLGLAAAAAAGAGLVYLFKEKMKEEVFKEKVMEKAGTGLGKTIGGINAVLPKLPWPSIEDYVSENFYEGTAEFRDTGIRGGRWKLGYARASLLPVAYNEKDYYLGGYLTFPPSTVKSILDDQAVRVICLDDGTGRGAAVFAVIDCVGLSGADVRTIRGLLKDFAAENNIVSINISATHCHSAIDTQGLWGVLPEILKNNIKKIKKGDVDGLISGRDPEFMQKLHETAAQAIKDAFLSMKRGRLFSKTFDDLKYSRDKRPPDVVVKDITKLHFIPDDGSTETVGVFMAAHPTALDPKEGELSADYIYYIEEEVNRAGSNFIFFQGPQLAVAVDRGPVIPEGATGRGFMEYGWAIGRHLMKIKEEEEEKVSPILNIRSKEVFVPGGNPVLMLVLKAGIVNNIALKTGPKAADAVFVTEVGYVELGKTLRLALLPGEFAPEMLVGGTLSAEESVNKEEWPFEPMKDMLAEGKNLVVVGLCNDSIGYILPDNDYGPMLAEDRYEESVSAGKETGSTIVGAFRNLVDECGRLR